MMMVALRTKRALWGANASLLQSFTVGDIYRGPTAVEMTLDFRGGANETPAKSAHNQCFDFLCITPFAVALLKESKFC